MAERHTWELVAKTIGSQPSLVRQIDGSCAYRLERYFTTGRQLKAPPLPQPVVGMQFGGKKVSHISNLGQLSIYPSVTVVFPAGKKSNWSASSTVDLALFYFQGAALKQLESALSKAVSGPRAGLRAGGPIAFDDTVTSALARQLVSELAGDRAVSNSYITTLSSALLAQLCKRLSENKPATRLHSNTLHLYRVQETVSHIQSDLKADLSNARLAERVGLHQSHFRGLFQQVTGTTPHQYVMQARLEMANRLLSQTDLPLASIAEECGFSSQAHMSSCFRRSYNMTPREFRGSPLNG